MCASLGIQRLGQFRLRSSDRVFLGVRMVWFEALDLETLRQAFVLFPNHLICGFDLFNFSCRERKPATS